ncbi:MAG: 1-deoxy-D-xylulose-5-phosphate reductoisomerase [Termitinemataceae bacterium]|nr:MAG: 1-deoxy-D-xylulose-5-phosphate reductoisomerase [Termitinemataceae bacterium]
MTRNIAVLGATGSIGRSTLDVIRESNLTAANSAGACQFNIVLLSANNNSKDMDKLACEFPAARIVLSGTEGSGALLNAIAECGADIAVNGIAGAAGLRPSLAVLESGADLALANKETIVMASDLVFKTARKNESLIIPVDSEHSAIFNLVNAHGRDALQEIIITASGGPFRKYTKEQLQNVQVEDALAHPTWNMGTKITIDSASLANKGLEVIEAAKLFDMPSEKIKVVVHPQSIIHSMVRLKNGAVFAEASQPDMRVPISNAVFYPQVVNSIWGLLDFTDLTLTFEQPDTERFPMLRLAYEALEKGGSYTIAYNAANEVAVAAFLAKEIFFTDIANICAKVLDQDFSAASNTIEEILDTDKKARTAAGKIACN